MRTLIIDGDILAYKASYGHDVSVDWGDGEEQVITDLPAALREVHKLIDEWKEEARCDEHIICLSNPAHRYFRHDIYPNYKMHRSSGRQPALRHSVENYLRVSLEAFSYDNLEADDVMGIIATTPGVDAEYVIGTVDKDLKQIPGWNYNMNSGKLEWIEPIAGTMYFYEQALSGDPTDGYPGCPKIGPVRAQKIIEPFIKRSVTRSVDRADHTVVEKSLDEPALWKAIVSVYSSRGLDEQHALTQARVARILQFQDYDQETGKVNLWLPPE